ncbi:MAG: hypothetical protein HYX68_15670 [Planctomycetes bacterium]|nr:hypothetical protein [Planctomycetota bacterium]
MALVCPECKQIFEQNGICPLCNVVLLYHAPNLKPEASPSSLSADLPAEWQQTPWGKIFVGLILALGLSFGLQQMLTAGFLATGDWGDVWNTLLGIVLHHAVLAVSLLVGGMLSGAGQSRGIVYGALVGFASGIISSAFQYARGESYSPMLATAVPLIHLATGALGGALGMLIWRPTPRLPELDSSTPTPVVVSNLNATLANLFAGQLHVGRICAGAFVAVMGVVWSKAILDFLLRATNGSLTISSQLQAQLVGMEIIALVALVGSGFAGATTRNGLKQGLFVGLATAAIVLGIQISSPRFTLESAVFTDAGLITVSMIGGWFGGQLFPPVGEKRRRRLWNA